MSISNRDVAVRLFTHAGKSLRSVQGSHFRVDRVGPSAQTAMAGFVVHSLVYSYNTVIAQLMMREDGHGYELWMTSHRYSPTTDRHMHWLWNALHLQNSKSPRESSLFLQAVPGYYVPQGTAYSLRNRCDPAVLAESITHARNNLTVADAPRLHASTRTAHLQGAHRLLTEALFRATNCMPQQAPRAYPELPETIEAAQAHLAYVERLLSLPIEQARLSIRAVNELSRD